MTASNILDIRKNSIGIDSGIFDNREWVQGIVDILGDVIGMENGPVGLHEPLFLDRESEYLSECLKTREVSSTGRFISEMENRLREITGCAGAILVGNGTVGLQVSLTAAGVGQGHEVLVPALTFVAAANAVVHCGATPHLVDVSEENLGVDAVRLEEYLAENCDLTENGARNRSTGRVIRALLVVHTFGHPPDMDALAQICRNWNMVMVEDGAEALGSTCRGRHCCTTGLVGIVSFNGNKIITTGGGGAVLTMDPQLATELRDLISTARIPHRWEIAHTTAAFNFRLPNLNAALGMAQLDRFEKILDVKRRLAAEYESHFSGYVGLKFLKEPEYARSNYWLNALILDREMASQRDEVLEKTNDSGFGTRPAWIPMHFLPMYSSVPRMDLRVTEDMAARIVNLPSGPGILWEK